ncbi:MAG TPA: hypothetical protein VIV15_09810, partial [Anaerolineales bacterium]
MSSPLFTAFTLVSGISWSIVYIDVINRGFRDRTYGMPFFALAFNISWEFIYSFLIYQGFPLQRAVNILWFLLDLAILYTYFWYGPDEFPKAYAGLFLPWSLAGILSASGILYFAGTEFADVRGGTYSAFAQNLMMSVLFIGMLARRDGVRGQSMYIAVFKCIGTLAPTILVWITIGSPLVLALGIGCFFYDLIYIVMLYRKFLALSLNPFT